MTARNVGEMLGGRLRSVERAVWGHTKPRKRKTVKPDTDAENLDNFAKAMGIPQTKGSTKAFLGRSKKTGKLRAFITNDNTNNKSWAASVSYAAMQHRPHPILDGAVSVTLLSLFFRPC